MKPLISLALTVPLLLAAGCKIQIEVPEGGHVVTESGNYRCTAGNTCSIDVVDLFFDETFDGVATAGFQFTGWKKRDRGFCGGSDEPCRLFTSGFEGNEALMGFLERQDEVFFLEPQFEPVVVDAFDPEIFLSRPFLVREGGFDVTYRFNEDGSYTKQAGPIFARGQYQFERNNQVIHYTRLAETDEGTRTGFAVFVDFDRDDTFYTVCVTEDQDVRSALRAVDICENGASGNADSPTLQRYFVN